MLKKPPVDILVPLPLVPNLELPALKRTILAIFRWRK